MSSGKLKLRRSIKSIKPDKVVVFIGKRETGKSFLVKDLLYYHKDVPIGTVISGTGKQILYGHMVPSLFIHDAFTPQVVANAVKRQRMVIKKINKDKAQFGSSNIDTHFLFLMIVYMTRVG